ncbi:SPOR domain-containing protein [Pseudoblastomonas halimionae]|uniref:SPOR domain-containing protein n=1 Tax=Alteriqipengyuania halimionae TaxID=1926630 RepID=A0A6I4U2H6_9SPHN|nr:SPOR domain-containing protein [Alteriqipengyuania halimionae]MXP10118.1 hypothetical protein [Alteriqipengyuania halimionae]
MAALVCAGAAFALPEMAVAQEVVQRLPPPEEQALKEALQALARNPDDMRSLLIAGRSALVLGDSDAALGFFSRARDLDPGSDEALAGIAAVQVRRNDPVAAIALFDNVGEQALGDPVIDAERALAYDLVGAQGRAQTLYRAVMARSSSEELIRRLALSLAISGDREGSEATLLPLLQRQNKSAWRTRAFSLAILGASDEAVTVANAVMPAGLAREMEPFLRIMERLTRAQQAAAANLGRFPGSSEIGRDTPEIAAYAAQPPVRKPRRSAGDGLVPKGEPLGGPPRRASAAAPSRQSSEGQTTAPPASRTDEPDRLARQAATLRDQEEQRRREGPTGRSNPPATGPVAENTTQPPAPTVAEPVVQAPSQAPAQDVAQSPVREPSPTAGPGFDLATVPGTIRDEPVQEPAREPDFASAFGDIGKPDAMPEAEASSGAVDVTAIKPARPEPEDPPPPPNPARIWVQLGIGRDVDALAFDWRRLKRKYEILDGRDAYRSVLGQTNRMVTGPFASRAEAMKMVNALKEEGHESLVWRSGDGEEVVLLPDG